MSLRRAIMSAAGLLLLASGVHAGYQEGVDAYRRGDFRVAEREFRKDAGHPEAQFVLGLIHERGEGVKADAKTAAGWYAKSARAGHAGAQFNLGLMHWQGRGVARHPGEAVRLYTASARGGLSTAMVNLGELYLNGQGVRRDAVAGLALVGLAARIGTAEARRALQVLEPRHSRQEVTQAHALVDQMLQQIRIRGDLMAPVLRHVGKGEQAEAEWYPDTPAYLRSDAPAASSSSNDNNSCRWVSNKTMNPFEPNSYMVPGPGC